MSTMANEVAWLVEFEVKPGAHDAVRALMDEMVASTRLEPGTLSYGWFRSADGEVVVIYERFADSAAVLQHLATVERIFAQRLPSVLTQIRQTVFGAPTDEARRALSGANPRYLTYFGGFVTR